MRDKTPKEALAGPGRRDDDDDGDDEPLGPRAARVQKARQGIGSAIKIREKQKVVLLLAKVLRHSYDISRAPPACYK